MPERRYVGTEGYGLTNMLQLLWVSGVYGVHEDISHSARELRPLQPEYVGKRSKRNKSWTEKCVGKKIGLRHEIESASEGRDEKVDNWTDSDQRAWSSHLRDAERTWKMMKHT